MGLFVEYPYRKAGSAFSARNASRAASSSGSTSREAVWFVPSLVAGTCAKGSRKGEASLADGISGNAMVLL